MCFVLGIDEAGYGPMLGPLVIGATLWRDDRPDAPGDYWQRLNRAVCRPGGKRSYLVPVGDSKEVFDRKHGVASLERSVLAFATAGGRSWATLAELLNTTDFGAPGLPWYRDLARSLPADPSRSAFAGAAERVRGVMAAAGLACAALRAHVVAESAFNERVARTRNKASVVVEAVLKLIDWAGRQAGDAGLRVVVDRLGGRADYRQLLQQAFPDFAVRVVEIAEQVSRYELTRGAVSWQIEFVIEADRQHMPVALASMYAKYIRELLMDEFNRYWRTWLPELRPTAGYYGDAERFLEDIRPVIDHSGVATEMFVRSR